MVDADVSWQIGSTAVHGTLVRPEGLGPFPGVVMVAGSGPTDRDWNSPLLPGTNGSARLLAGALARAGIASLRYDKRGTGPGGPATLQAMMGRVSMQSFADEVAGAAQTLAAQDFVRRDRIFGLGNSEGTLHVLNHQVGAPEIPFAGLVLAAPPGRPVGAVARMQLAEQAAALPNGDALLTVYDAAIARFTAGEPTAPDPALPQGVQDLLHSLEHPANLPFARELWLADGAALLPRVDVPVLVIIGKRDIQVDWQADGEPLQRAAAGRANVTFRFPEHANHILKHEPRERSQLAAAEVQAGYNAAGAGLDPEAEADIVEWIQAHV